MTVFLLLLVSSLAFCFGRVFLSTPSDSHSDSLSVVSRTLLGSISLFRGTKNPEVAESTPTLWDKQWELLFVRPSTSVGGLEPLSFLVLTD